MLKPHFLSKTEFYECKKVRERGVSRETLCRSDSDFEKMIVVASNLAFRGEGVRI